MQFFLGKIRKLFYHIWSKRGRSFLDKRSCARQRAIQAPSPLQYRGVLKGEGWEGCGVLTPPLMTSLTDALLGVLAYIGT